MPVCSFGKHIQYFRVMVGMLEDSGETEGVVLGHVALANGITVDTRTNYHFGHYTY